MEIRRAQPGDETAIMAMIHGLAEFEKEPHEVVNTAERLAIDLFEKKHCEATVALQDQEIIGFALFYTAYSTWKGPVLYLEDLFVKPEFRGTGAGSKLFDEVVSIAESRGHLRMDWQVLQWNVDAISFYERKNATIDKEWYNGRIFFKS
jgi:GNAT superfamily N-acetyltransferase